MKKYKVVYRIVGEIVVNADDEEDARNQFYGMPDEVLHRNAFSNEVTDTFETDEDLTHF